MNPPPPGGYAETARGYDAPDTIGAAQRGASSRVGLGWLIEQRIIDLRQQASELSALRALLPADIEGISPQAAAALWRLLTPGGPRPFPFG